MNDADPGYSITEHIFDHRELVLIREAIEVSDIPRTRAGARHLLRVPEVRAMAAHPGLSQLAAAFVGPAAFPFRATLFDKSAASNWLVAWHQDTALPLRERLDVASWGPWSVKGGVLHAMAPARALATVIALRVHLDDSTPTNGALRVLPGTHSSGVLSHDDILEVAARIRAVECVCSAGGVVAMRALIIPASSKTRDAQARRVLHLEYAPTVHLGAGIELAVG